MRVLTLANLSLIANCVIAVNVFSHGEDRATKPSISITLPTTTTKELVHGICFDGAVSASASSDNKKLDYETIENFSSGVQAWGDRYYIIDGVEKTPCAGGIFLRPSKYKSIEKGTTIKVEADFSDSMTMCVFVEPPGYRDGGWYNALPDIGFTNYEEDFTGFKWGWSFNPNQIWGTLCMEFPQNPTPAPSLLPSASPSVSLSPSISQKPSPGLPDTVSITLPETTTDQLVHGICFDGAVSASASSDYWDLDYETIENFSSGVKGWGDRHYIIVGVESTPCAGGIFLKPSKFKSIEEGTTIEIEAEFSDSMTLCVFVEPGHRDGGLYHSLPEIGFTNNEEDFTGFKWGWASSPDQTWDTLCMDFPRIPTPAPSLMPSTFPTSSSPSISQKPSPGLPETVSITLPMTTTKHFVHGICFDGAVSASASSDNKALYYKMIENFSSGVKAWGDRPYIIDGVESTPCAGGIFLRPSKYKSIEKGTTIKIEAEFSDSMTLCVFVEPGHRDGGWYNALPAIGFTNNEQDFTELKWGWASSPDQTWDTLCIDFPQHPTAVPSLMPSASPSASLSPSISQKPSPGLPETVSITLPATTTNHLVHGICIDGAVSASASSNHKKLYYKMIENFSSEVTGWGDRPYIIDGVENTPCAGGLFLRPSKYKSIKKGTKIEVEVEFSDSMTLCVFVEPPGKRDGGWYNSLPAIGFTNYEQEFTGFNWGWNGFANSPFGTLCINYPLQPSPPPSLMPSALPSVSLSPSISQKPSSSLPDTVSITLPATTTKHSVHGICVDGAASASATSTYKKLYYKTIENFSSGVQAWRNRLYIIDGVESTPCAGGIFLRPSKHKKIKKGTTIEVEIKRDTSDSMTLCVFVEPPGKRDGGWYASLPPMGFTNHEEEFTEFKWGWAGSPDQTWGMLCKDV